MGIFKFSNENPGAPALGNLCWGLKTILMAKVCSKSVNFAIAMSIHQLLALTPHQGPFETLKRIVLESRASQSKVIMIIATLVIMIRSWSSHIKYLQHDGKKTHTCNQCGFSSISAFKLKRHMPVHSGEKHFSCTQCNYSCTTAAHLKLHILTHSGEKPFNCTHSKYSCTQAVHLKNHMATQSGEKPFGVTSPAHSLVTSRGTWKSIPEKRLSLARSVTTSAHKLVTSRDTC